MKKAVLSIDGLMVRRSQQFSLEVSALHVAAGQVICLAGANGCGKTTLIETVVGLLTPDLGVVKVQGKPISSNDITTKCQIGYVPDDENWIIPELTARELFALQASLYKRAGVTVDMEERVRSLAATLLFTSFDQQIGSLSHGNKKKVQIIAALMHQPKLLIVDELRNGLDPIAIKDAENLLQDLARHQGVAILAATHDLWWAERMAETIVMLSAGKMLYQARTADIVSSFGSVENKFMELYAKEKVGQ